MKNKPASMFRLLPLMASLSFSVMLSGIMMGAQAQTVRFNSYKTTSITTAEGIVKPDMTLYTYKLEEFRKYRDATKEYFSFLSRVASDYIGNDVNCINNGMYFLPGDTESAFRSSEKSLERTFATPAGKFVGYNTVKSYPAAKVTGNITASAYILKAMGSSKNQYNLHAYFFNPKLEQGVLLMCWFTKNT